MQASSSLASFVTAAFALIVAASVASAQSNTGEIDGVVRDVSGAVVPGASVVARHPEIGRAHV